MLKNIKRFKKISFFVLTIFSTLFESEASEERHDWEFESEALEDRKNWEKEYLIKMYWGNWRDYNHSNPESRDYTREETESSTNQININSFFSGERGSMNDPTSN